MRQDGSYTSPNIVALDQGCVSDFDSGDVSDRVQRSGREDADLDSQIACPRTRFGLAVRQNRETKNASDRPGSRCCTHVNQRLVAGTLLRR